MIWIRDEGELVRNGINFYPLSNKQCRGFVAKAGRMIFACYYSTVSHRIVACFR